jgi:glycosyltransferase involved in cell wall biosynthesis
LTGSSRVTFVLPARSPHPIGAFRVVYELSNRLAARGHLVAVVHPRTAGPPSGVVARSKALLWVERYRRDSRALAPWFKVDPAVRLLPATHLDPAQLPDADVVIAVTWEPPFCVAAADDAKGRAFYFIQEGAPKRFVTEAEVEAAWRLPIHKIVISDWLEQAVRRAGGEEGGVSRVPIGVDLEAWGVDVPAAERPPRVGAFLNPIKGQVDVIAALGLLRTRIPELTAACYGTAPRPADLPDWADYTRLPDRATLRSLYNSCSVFVQASREEGWGLPPNEAMACGCALVTYDNGGSREYAVDGETARVVEENGSEHLAAAMGEILCDRELRLGLARRGCEAIARFTWERSTQEFEAVLFAPPASPSS